MTDQPTERATVTVPQGEVVLWGAREGDIQFGSRVDRLWPLWLRRYARAMRIKAAPVPTPTEADDG